MDTGCCEGIPEVMFIDRQMTCLFSFTSHSGGAAYQIEPLKILFIQKPAAPLNSNVSEK